MAVSKRLQELLLQLEWAKRKWWAKDQTLEALWIIGDRFLQIMDYLWQWISFYILFQHWWLYYLTINFGFNFDEFYQMKLEFKFELPDIEDILKGLLIKIIRTDINELFREFYFDYYGIELPVWFRLDRDTFIEYFTEKYAWDILKESYIIPARYGITYYGNSVYWKEDLSNAISGTLEKHGFYPYARYIADIFEESLDVISALLEELKVRLSILKSIFTEMTVCGCVICGVSKVPEEKIINGERYFVLRYTTPEGETVEAYIKTIDHALFGTICGISRCGYTRCLPPEQSFFHPNASEFIIYRVNEIMGRFLSNITGLSLSEGTIGAVEPFRATKTLDYGTKLQLRYMIDFVVRGFLSRYPLDPMTINAYVNFAVDYVFSRIRKHHHYEQWLRTLSQEEYEKFFIAKYKRMGLDETLLRQIIALLNRWLPSWLRTYLKM